MTTVTSPATAAVPAADAEVTIRAVERREEYEACVELQRDTWGRSFSDIVPTSVMSIAVKVGGICLGAFGPGGEMLGFVFGVTGPRDGELAHWSHMLAVRDEARNAGIGKRLKFAQREVATERGVDTLYWTFDPLVARNAHFNLNRLGASVAEFVPDMYGASDSDLHRLGTDRFVARWSPRVSAGVERPPPARCAARDVAVTGTPGRDGRFPRDAGMIEVPVPRDIDAMVAERFEEALAWRRSNRAAMTRLFAEGYEIVGFGLGEKHGRYRMARGPGGSARGGHEA